MNHSPEDTNRRLLRFRNCHKGGRAILVCNGPSLNRTNFSLIRNEICIGLNKIFLGFSKYKFYPKYYVAINKRVIKQSKEEIERLNCINFISDMGSGTNPIEETALTYLIQSRPEQIFHTDLSKGFFEGYTVTFAALQIAYYMGFSKIIIVGMDHHYSYKGAPNESHKMIGADPNHFDQRYFSENTWDNPDLDNSEKYYRIARSAFEKEKRQIIDCTIGGHCNVFSKTTLEEALR